MFTNISKSNSKLDSVKAFTEQSKSIAIVTYLIIDLDTILKFVSKPIILNKNTLYLKHLVVRHNYYLIYWNFISRAQRNLFWMWRLVSKCWKIIALSSEQLYYFYLPKRGILSNNSSKCGWRKLFFCKQNINLFKVGIRKLTFTSHLWRLNCFSSDSVFHVNIVKFYEIRIYFLFFIAQSICSHKARFSKSKAWAFSTKLSPNHG